MPQGPRRWTRRSGTRLDRTTCAPSPCSLGARPGGAPMPARALPKSTAGSPRASDRGISPRRARCSTGRARRPRRSPRPAGLRPGL